MNLLDVRDKLAVALAPVADDDPFVLSSLVDAIEPPALMLGWADPWLGPDGTFGACGLVGHLAVTAVAARLMPGDGIATLEWLIDYVRTRVRSGSGFILETVSGPRVFVVAKTNYLAARIDLRVDLD